MKLLSIYLGKHDSNCCYFDGQHLHYYKSERKYQKKYHVYDSIEECINDIEKIWNISLDDIDQIAFGGFIREKYSNLPDQIEKMEFLYHKNTIRVKHHYSHALSTKIFCSAKPDVSFVIDGEGEKRTWAVFKNNQMIDDGLIDECGSIGDMMQKVGRFLGIKSTHYHDIAGKLMGLQSFGKVNQEYYEKIKHFGMRNINDIFNYDNWKECKYEEYSVVDWIHTVHERVGDLLVEFFSEYANETDVISYSGGVAQNIIWNTKLKQKFPNLIIGPHSSDEGISIGSMEHLRFINNLSPMSIKNFPYGQEDESPIDDPTDDTIKQAARMLAEGKIIAWYQGNGEIGPRALGNRSILMDPRLVDGKDKVNLIKNRENYRPFGASILEEKAAEYFSIPFEPFINPYMVYLVNVNNNDMPAITHVDGTCRLQTVGNENVIFRKLLEEFYKITGCPVVLNTSLNIAGKPIVDKCSDAVLLYETTSLDALFVGNKIYIDGIKIEK